MLGILSLLFLYIFEGFVEDLLRHLERERAEVIIEPAMRRKQLKTFETLEHFEGLLHTEIIHMLRHIREMVVAWVEFWIFPGVLVSRISGRI